MNRTRDIRSLQARALAPLALAFTVACARPAAEVPAALAEPSSTTRWVRSRPASEASLLEAPARVLVDPGSAAAVSPPLRARVVRVRVRAGQAVARDEALLDVLMPELIQAAGAFSAATLKLEAYTRRRVQLDALKADGLVRSVEVAELDATLATVRADAQAARATLRAAGVPDRQAEGLLTSDGTLSLRAPIAGLVTAVDAIPGEVREPTGRPFVELASVGQSLVEARLPGAFVEGASFEFISTSGVHVPVKALSVSPRIEARDGARLAWFSADEDHDLLPGAPGRVRLVADPGWRAVPTRAVVGHAEGARVVVRRGETPTVVPVRVVATSGAEAVVDGLPEGVEVAAEGELVELGQR
jgi:membrane fusion protein, heavy metal efflux system